MSLDKFKAAKESVRKAQEESNRVIKEAFSEAVKPVFDNNPELMEFRWYQYTPYFNDGDTCTFRAGTDYFEIKHPGDAANEVDENGWIEEPYWYDEHKNLTSPLRKASDDVAEFLLVFDNDDYFEMFGDHVMVTVTRDGVEIDDYSIHD